jgi:hypothetical protein
VRIAPSLILEPEASARIAYDSNIYNVEVAKRDDGFMIVEPRLSLRSDFARHGFELRGGAQIRRYFNITGENSEQYDVAARGVLELGGRIDVEPEIGFVRSVEQRGTAGDLFTTDSPVIFEAKHAALRISRSGGILGLSARGSIRELDYENASRNGAPVDLSTRNVTMLRGQIRADVRLNDRIGAFARIDGNKIEYARQTATPRDSSGYSVLGGIHLQITSLVDLQAALGYIHQDFDNPAFRPVGGINYNLALNWTPTPRWQVEASAERNIDHPGNCAK